MTICDRLASSYDFTFALASSAFGSSLTILNTSVALLLSDVLYCYWNTELGLKFQLHKKDNSKQTHLYLPLLPSNYCIPIMLENPILPCYIYTPIVIENNSVQLC